MKKGTENYQSIVSGIEGVEDYSILLLDKSGNIKNWNKGAEKIKGYTPVEIIGKNFQVFYTKEDQKNKLYEHLMQEAITNGKAIHEGWRVRKDGNLFWGSTVITTQYDANNNITGFIKITRDLTDQKQAEERLKSGYNELEALLNNTDEIFLILDKELNVVSFNKNANYNAIKYFEKDIRKGMSFLEFVSDERIPFIRETYAKAFAGVRQETEITLTNRAGDLVHFKTIIKPLVNSAGIIDALFITERDITEQKIAAQKLMKVNRLYAFVSAINQTIVHVNTQEQLYNNVCRIAIEIGKFEMALIAVPDTVAMTLQVVAGSNAPGSTTPMPEHLRYDTGGPTDSVLKTAAYYAINDFEKADSIVVLKEYALQSGFRSSIILPVMKAGQVIATYNLFSSQANLFDDEEIRLLEEVSGDISFSLEVFEKERQRKAFEKAIKHKELRLKQAQEIAHFGSWELDLTTEIATWSEEACRIYGLDTGDDIRSYNEWMSFIHPDDVSYVQEMMGKSNAAALSTSFYHRITRKNGAIRHIHSQAHFEFDKDGLPIALYGVAHDITDLKLAEETIQQSKANLRQIVDLIPQSVFVMDRSGKFVFVNKSFAALYGRTPKELVRKNMTDTIPEQNSVDVFIQQAREVIDTGKIIIVPEMAFRDHTGKERTFHAMKVPFDMAGKDGRAMLSVSLDITDQKKAETERSKMMSDIVQRNKDLEQFSYIVSHNLRSPVANIIGIAELIHVAKSSKEEEATMMAEMYNCVKKLDGVIKDLNYVLQVKHQVNEKKELIQFSDLIEDIKYSISHLLKSKEVNIICDFSQVHEMQAIKGYLYSIFFNIISNSIKYRKADVPPVIEISAIKTEETITLIFKDNGIGIDLKKRKDDIFGLYKRFHFHTEGKGMGLYMVKTQVEAMGGKINVVSEVNKGTEFKIVFDINPLF